MIVVKLMGGLGNQMFQYALGKHLALRTNSKLVLDKSFLNISEPQIDYTLRKYELDIFDLECTTTDLFFKPSLFNIIYRKLLGIKYLQEEAFEFDSRVLNRKGNLYLSGFWQSELYFKDIATIIQKDFIFPRSITSLKLNFIDQITDSNSVSIHFRRSDYVTNNSASSHHGTLPIEYYSEALNWIKKNVLNPTFFIFSDEEAWVRENFNIPDASFYFVSNLTNNHYADMWLMSICKHNIIANSSFSWWGAWLNQNDSKIVISPKKWFNDNNLNTSTLIPNTWKTL